MRLLLRKSILLIALFIWNKTLLGQDVTLSRDSLKYAEKFKATDMYYSTKSQDAQHYYEAGLKLFNESQFKESIPLYKKALELDGNFIDAMDNLANSYRYLGILDSAEFWLKKSVSIFPQGYVAHQNLSIVYNSTERYNEALAECDHMIRINPENAEGYFGKTSVFVLLGKGDEVVYNAKKALVLYKKNEDPYEMDALYMIGVGYYLKGDKAQAKAYLTDAQKLGKEIPAELAEIMK